MPAVVLQAGDATAMLLRVGGQLLGLGIAVATVSGLVALLYRWYVREHVPNGLAVLFGLTVVALYLGTTTALGQVIGGEKEVLELRAVLPNLAAFAVGGFASYVGLGAGDRLGTDLFVTTGGRDIDADVSEIVQTVGRVTSVRLPDEVDDIVGYDPMPAATRAALEGRRFLFPRRLSSAELRSRLVSRLKTDYGVGHVDLELDDDGSVSFLAIGSRAAGIGPTLPPSTNAVAIRADPANAASAGDLVQVWATDPPRRVLTGELRGIAGEVVTVAIDAAETPKLDQTETYRLVTLPVEDRPDREFASLLRAADETMGTVTIEPGSELDGATAGSVDATVVAITSESAPPRTIPASTASLAAGDVLYLVAKPETLRRIETAAAGSASPDEPGPADDGTGAPDSGVAAVIEETDAEGGPETDVGTEAAVESTDSPGSGGDSGDSAETDGQTASGGPGPETGGEGADPRDESGDESRIETAESVEDATGPESVVREGTEATGPGSAHDEDATDGDGDGGAESERGTADADAEAAAVPESEPSTDADEPDAGRPEDGDTDAEVSGDQTDGDGFDSFPADDAAHDVDVDDFLTSADDVEVWNPNDLLAEGGDAAEDDEEDSAGEGDGTDER